MQTRSRGLRELCRLLGYSAQAYYQYRRTETKRILEEDLIIGQVLLHRKLLPRSGGRQLHELLQPFMELHRCYLGRDLLYDVLRANNLLVRRYKGRKPRTTFSDHLLKKYPDLAKGLKVDRPNALWVSDITYIRLSKERFAYLSLVTDAYSRKIVGFHLSADLSADSCLLALRSEEHTSELQSHLNLVCRLLLEKKTEDSEPAPGHGEDSEHRRDVRPEP